MVSEEKITLEPVTPHLKFKRDNWGNILSLQYKEDGFSEEPSDDEKPDIENPITEYNPFEDMIFESKDECDVALRRFAVHFASELRTDRNPHDFFSVEKGHYLYEGGDLEFTAHIIGDNRSGYFIMFMRRDTDIEGTKPHRKGILINGNTDGYYCSYGANDIFRVSKSGSWRFIDSIHQMTFTSYENAAKVICFLVGRSTSKLRNDNYLFNGHNCRAINVNESTNLFTGAFDGFCKYTPFAVTGIYVMSDGELYHTYPICETKYPIAKSVIPKKHTVLDPITNIVSDKWHNIYQIKDVYGDDIPVGTEVSNKEYSEEISITQYPFSSFETFKSVVKEYLGEDYDVIESCLHDTEYPDEDPRHIRNSIWVVSNYKRHIVWNYMVLVERIPYTDTMVYRIRFIDSKNNAIFV